MGEKVKYISKTEKTNSSLWPAVQKPSLDSLHVISAKGHTQTRHTRQGQRECICLSPGLYTMASNCYFPYRITPLSDTEAVWGKTKPRAERIVYLFPSRVTMSYPEFSPRKHPTTLYYVDGSGEDADGDYIMMIVMMW